MKQKLSSVVKGPLSSQAYNYYLQVKKVYFAILEKIGAV